MDREQEKAFQKLYDDLHGKGKGGRVYIWFDEEGRKGHFPGSSSAPWRRHPLKR